MQLRRNRSLATIWRPTEALKSRPEVARNARPRCECSIASGGGVRAVRVRRSPAVGSGPMYGGALWGDIVLMLGVCVDCDLLVPSSEGARRGGGGGGGVGDGSADGAEGCCPVGSGGGGGGGTRRARGGGGGGGAERAVVAEDGESSACGWIIASDDISCAKHSEGVSATMSPPENRAARGKAKMSEWVLVASMAAVLAFASRVPGPSGPCC